MIFARLALDQAVGATLAHTTRLPGRTLRKGHILDDAALALLARAGHADILAARLGPDDVAEDAAAARIAAALSSPGLITHPARTGRANLAATAHGLFRAATAAINALNALHEGLTIATLPDATVTAPGTLVVTVKIIPFALPGAVLAQAETLAATVPPLRLAPLLPLRAGLVLTSLPGVKQSMLDATQAATRARIEKLTGTLLPPRQTAHETPAIAAALTALIADGADLLLIAGASATVDRGDVAPQAVQHAGGRVLHFGMPVDPGNLLCLGEIAGRPTLVLPGCARSPRLNGIDLLLARLFAGETVGPADIAALGVGGLLAEATSRPAPRAPRRAPRVAAILLAAGSSSRMGRHKLLIQDSNGIPMAARAADALLASGAHPVLAVLGYQAVALAAALAPRQLRLINNPDYATGMASSLRAGLAALPPGTDAVLVGLADMPNIRPATLAALRAAWRPGTIVVPTHNGQRGNPIVWDRGFIPEMMTLLGDTGARPLLAKHASLVIELPVQDPGIHQDYDTEDTLLSGF